MKLQTEEALGLHMAKMDGTLALLWNITDVIPLTSQKLGEKELWKQWNFSQKNSHCIFPHPKIWQLRLQWILLTLSYIQPAGPFCQVGDAQTLALKRLAAIFEGATRRKTKINVPPTEKEDNNAPPRVRTHVSPPRVPNTTAQNLSPHHNKPPDLIPNSHRRQKTPLIRVVTPQTPHVMVRHSARQQYNLSQDMMAEAINQANHCFSISSQKPKQKSKLSIQQGRHHARNGECCYLPRYRQITQTQRVDNKIKVQD
jgi:hypothetical protein